MKYAHTIYQACECSWSDALQRGWDLYYLKEILAHGVAEFTYIKQDGTERVARGTNYPEIIPPSKAPSGRQQLAIEAGLAQPNYKSIAYYDLDKEEWRAFSVEKFRTLDRVLAITPIEC